MVAKLENIEIGLEKKNMENPTRPQKILPYKTYNKIGHLSKSRLGEGDHYIDPKTESLFLKDIQDPHSYCIVQEKLDGANVSVVRWKGEIIALSRSGYDCKNSDQEQFKMFHRYVNHYKERFENILIQDGMRIVGEWLALAHGIIYKFDVEPFVPFDIFFHEMPFPYLKTLKVLYRERFTMPYEYHLGGACSLNRAIKLSSKDKSYHGAEKVEGFIYRIEREGKPPLIAKYVHHDKIDGKYFNEDKSKLIWNWRDDLL